MKKNVLRRYLKSIEQTHFEKQTKFIKMRIVERYMSFLEQTEISIENTTIKHINDFFGQFRSLHPSTYNCYISHIRSFYKWLSDKRIITIDWGEHLIKKREPQNLPKNIPLHLMNKLCEPQVSEKILRDKDIRNQAIIEFMFSTGVRPAELLGLKVRYLSDDLSECFVPTSKRGKPRNVFLGQSARNALKIYFNARRINLATKTAFSRSVQESAVFTPTIRSDSPMNYATLKKIITQLSEERIGTIITPHQIRHTFATEMLRATNNIRAVQEMLGHRKIDSTMLYTHLCTADKRKTIEAHHPMNITDKFDKI